MWRVGDGGFELSERIRSDKEIYFGVVSGAVW